jgi:hypothetical protein
VKSNFRNDLEELVKEIERVSCSQLINVEENSDGILCSFDNRFASFFKQRLEQRGYDLEIHYYLERRIYLKVLPKKFGDFMRKYHYNNLTTLGSFMICSHCGSDGAYAYRITSPKRKRITFGYKGNPHWYCPHDN